MKTLYIIRHAKSSWDSPDLSDFDRPLNERGKGDAPRMGKRLKKRNVKPDMLLTSPAKRALSTCKRIAEQLGFPKEKIKTEPNLYHADEDQIFSVIKDIKDKHDVLIVFGHNPGMTDFVNRLRKDKKIIENIPTCGVVAFALDVNAWQDIQFGTGKFLFFDYPKSEDG